MLIQVSTDRHIGDYASLETQATFLVKRALRPFKDHITRVDVHLTDENGHSKSAIDKKCVMEARLDGVPPLVVSATAQNVVAVLDSASRKLRRSVVSAAAKKSSHRSKMTFK